MLNKRAILLCLVLGAVTLGLYWAATSFGFIDLDDMLYVTGNPHIQQGVSPHSIEWAFTSNYGGNWHPLTWISHMIDWQMYGPKPGGHHLTNVLFHCCNAMLLFLVLLRMTGAMWPSWVVAALFAWHPMHVESVAWVAERKDVLSTFFVLLTMLAYAVYVTRSNNKDPKSKIFYGLALLGFALSLLSKPMYVTLPFLLLLLDYWPLKRFELGQTSKLKELALEKVPLLALAVVASVFTCVAQAKFQSIVGLHDLSIYSRAGHACIAYLKYVGKLIWPTNMAIFYPFAGPPTFLHGAIGVLLVLALSVAALRRLRDEPHVPVGWFWFLGTLVPVIGIVQVGGQAMGDRYTYFPYIGLFIIVAWGAASFWEQKMWRPVIAGGAVAALAGCLAVSTVQLHYWRDNATLFDHALKVTHGNVLISSLRARQFANEGKLDEAYACMTNVLASQPDHPGGNFELGTIYVKKGDLEKAAASFNRAIHFAPTLPQPHYQLGLIYLQKGNLDSAYNELSSAIALAPDDPIAQCRLGFVCSQLKDYAGAIQHYRAALEQSPTFVEPMNNLAWIRAANEKAEFRNGVEAVALARQACEETDYHVPGLMGTLAAAYAEAGQFTNAVETATKARDLASAQHQPKVAERNEQLLKFYRAGRAYHEGDGQ